MAKRSSLAEVLLFLLSVYSAFPSTDWAEVKMAPLSPVLLNCKKVYLIDESGDLKVFDNLYDKLTKWGRWDVVRKSKGLR
jgi:hypothetical protein